MRERQGSISLILFYLLLTLPQATQAFIPPEAIKVTSVGHNRQPIFISNSTFLFVSSKRHHQQDPQLYFKDLKQNKEKQITYQRGILSNGFYVDNSGDIIYSSTTDEDKETPYALKKYLDRYPSSVKNDSFFQVDFAPQEVYQSKIDGTDIKRLTKFSGYDGFPVYLRKKDRLYFSRWQNGKISLYAKSLSRNLAAWHVTPTSGHDIGLQLSSQENQFVWSRFSPDFKTSQLMISGLDFKKPNMITIDSGVSWSPSWHPNGKSIVYSARNDKMNNYDLFEISKDGQCQRKLTAYAGDEFFPSVSPDGKTILFTSTMSGGEQIYKISYPGPLSCKKEEVAEAEAPPEF